MSELWKDIKGLEYKYQVSSRGRVIRISKHGMKSFCYGTKDVYGYIQITIMGKIYKMHRLVAEAFLPNPENKKTVNHKNGDKSNNYLSNLEWMTQAENNQHCFDSGLRKPTNVKGERNPRYKTGVNVRGEYPKICLGCGVQFIAKFPRHRFCCRGCGHKKRVIKSDPGQQLEIEV